MYYLMLSPEFEKLKLDVVALRQELLERMAERDHLLFVVCENIRMEYLLEAGHLEVQAYKLWIDVQRLMRMVTLAQAAVNRQEPVDWEWISLELEAELLAYRKRLDEKLGSIQDAIIWSTLEKLTRDELIELKTLYRKIVKALHPDLNPKVTTAQALWFHRAAEAYQNGDLRGMRLIAVLLSNESEEEPGLASAWQAEKMRLEGLLQQLQNEVEEIRTTYPYRFSEYLKDPQKMEAHKKTLQETMQHYEGIIAAYTERLEAMREEDA